MATGSGAPVVLVTDGASDWYGQSRPSLGAVRALGAAGYRAAVTVSTAESLAASSRYCIRKVHLPDVHSPGYVEAVREELARNPYVCLLATSDTAVIALRQPGAELIDKVVLQAAVADAGLSFPPTRVFDTGDELLDGAGELEYPVLVKPAVGKPPRRASSPADLTVWAGRPDALVVQPYLQDPMRTVNGVMHGGRLRAVVHQRYLRTWPPEAGMALAAVTTGPDEELEARVATLLRNHEGIFEVELCGPYVLDVNPRVYGSVMLSVAAGANLVGIHADLAAGRDVPFTRGRPGAFYRWLEADLRHVARGLRGGSMTLGQAVATLRPRPGAAHGGAEGLKDPGPMIKRIRYATRTGGWANDHQGLRRTRAKAAVAERTGPV
jgi:hypothetical protein